MNETTNDRIRFRLDSRAKSITTIALMLIITGVTALFLLAGTSYLPAWFSMLVIAFVLLASLSIPRFMRISPHSLEIHCMMELVKIPIRDIKHIQPLSRAELRWSFPVWGLYGIFGYYGYYFHPRQRRIFRMYASQWKNFVLIEDIYEELYVVNCDDPEGFVAEIEKYKRDLI